MKTNRLLILPIIGIVSMSIFAMSNNKVNIVEASSASYWSSISNSDIATGGETLFNKIKTKISDAYTLSYSQLWNAFKTADKVPGTNYVWDMYGGFQFRAGTDQADGSSYDTDTPGEAYNREHCVPKSWWGDDSSIDAYTDLVHLLPSDVAVNSNRSNYTLGVVYGDATYSHSFPQRKDGNNNIIQTAGVTKVGNPARIENIQCPSGIVFEPDDQYKGDFARIYLYFATRYGGLATERSYGSAIFSTSFPYLTNYGLALLAKWHSQDPVSQKEINRNNEIENRQGNRNPYVDHPEWVSQIWKNYTSVKITPTLALTLSVSPTSVSMKEGDTVQLKATTSKSSVVYWSIDKDIALFDSTSGLTVNLTAFDIGKATITAKAMVDGEEVSKTISLTVTSDDPTPQPPAPTPTQTSGCGGNIATTSIVLSSLALIGIISIITISVLRRKKKTISDK